MLNIGIIGCGIVSGYGHLPAATHSPDWKLAAICDTNPQRLEAIHKTYPKPAAYTDHRQLLEHPQLDAVVVATHAHTHATITLDAFNNGLHVLCEKPMAASLDECRQMVDAADRAQRLLAINFNGRSALIYRQIKSLIDTGLTGPIRVVRIVYDWSAHQWQPPQRLDTFMRNGGPVVDSAVHFFEAAAWFTGQDVQTVEARGVTLPPYDNPQHAIAVCTLTGGAIALIEAGWIYTKSTKDQAQLFQIDVIGDQGVISYDNTSGRLRTYGSDATTDEVFQDSDKNFPHV